MACKRRNVALSVLASLQEMSLWVRPRGWTEDLDRQAVRCILVRVRRTGGVDSVVGWMLGDMRTQDLQGQLFLWSVPRSGNWMEVMSLPSSEIGMELVKEICEGMNWLRYLPVAASQKKYEARWGLWSLLFHLSASCQGVGQTSNCRRRRRRHTGS